MPLPLIVTDCTTASFVWQYWQVGREMAAETEISGRLWQIFFFPIMLECYMKYHFIQDMFFSIFQRLILHRAKYQRGQSWCKPVKGAGFHVAELWNVQGVLWPLFPCPKSSLTHKCVSWCLLLFSQHQLMPLTNGELGAEIGAGGSNAGPTAAVQRLRHWFVVLWLFSVRRKRRKLNINKVMG